MKQTLQQDDIKYLRAQVRLDEMIIGAFERIGEDDECSKCGGLGYTIEETPDGQGGISQWEARCECKEKAEEDREAEQ